QPQLVLLQKTLLNIEGLGRELYPDLDLWKTAYPILQEWMTERLSGKKVLQKIREQLPELGESLQVLPQIIQEIMQKASDGRLVMQVTNPELEGLKQSLDQDRHRKFGVSAGAASLIAGSLLIGLNGDTTWLGWVLVGAAVGLFLRYRPKS
ncbi:MAG: ubiquinone biosynthesis regulatory protein kinase UbiB, partial [Pseudomonadota bacterium]